MAKVNAFQIAGTNLWFWSNDHAPPHFHAKRSGEWEVRVCFLLDKTEMIEIVWSEKQPSKNLLSDLAILAETHRKQLLEQWEEIQQKQG